MIDKDGRQTVTKLSALASHLKSELFDQDDAIDTLVENLIKADILEKGKSFRALFTFIGLPNSGKSSLAHLLAQHEEHIDAIKVFHMDWYEEDSGTKTAQQLEADITAFLSTAPKSVLLFQDIDQAELQVQLTLYALLTEAGEKADFSQAVVIFTTTAASSFIIRQDFKTLGKEDRFAAHSALIEKLSKEQLITGGVTEQAFDTKLLDLINQNSVIVFNQLTLTSLVKIGARALHAMSQTFLQQSSIEIEYEGFDKVASLLSLSLSPYLNAKHIKQKLPEVMFTHIYQAMKLQDDVAKVRCEVSKEAEAFLTEALKDEAKLLKKLSDQHLRVGLVWEYAQNDEGVVCRISQADFSKQTMKLDRDRHGKASEVTFFDIAGHKKVKKELEEILALLKDPSRIEHFSMKAPKGMLLHGDPHIGKKMLSRAFANAADMPYIALSGIDLFNEQAIHEAYAKAQQLSPSIVLLEDIDIQGMINGVFTMMPITPVMQELDNLPQSSEINVFTIATASDFSNVQDSLTASGYLDIVVEVPKLDMEARRFFIEKILKMPNDGKIDVEKVVRYISGMDGDELQRIAHDAALYCARKNEKFITEAILLEQINIIKYGSKLENKQIRDIEKSMAKTAYHEAGHAVLSYFLMPDIKIEQVTVAPRSEALGFVSYHNDDYIDASSKADLFHNICVLLAGRIVTMEKYGEEGMETGAYNDLEVATMQIYAAIAVFGMDDELGYININGIETGYNRQLFSKRLENRMLVWLEDAKQATKKAVKEHWKAIEAVAAELIKKEVIDGEELQKLIKAAEKGTKEQKDESKKNSGKI